MNEQVEINAHSHTWLMAVNKVTPHRNEFNSINEFLEFLWFCVWQ
jgi:hypothetical protein